jgi:diguanylate cyclase (GGDEF)-like protein
VHNLTWAYQNSVKAQHARQRVLAASALSSVMRVAGDYAQAQSLIREVIDWDVAHDLKLDLSVSRYLLGVILGEMHENLHALEQLQQARRLSEQLGDEQGVAFADMRICENHAELNASSTARGYCQHALGVFLASGTSDMVKETRAALAQVDLLEGKPAAALLTLNAVLERGGADVLPRSVERMYKLRAEAEARLGDYKAAYRDYAEFVRRDQETNQSERVRQVTALRTRFEADREIERNESLQRQLALERERAERQRAQLRWTAALAATGVAVIALLSYIVFSSQRHRRQLLRLAGEDALTGLPNRRQTAQLTEAALASAARRGQVLTLALLDIDHFKRINDQCGHAEGDRVLQEFASRARQELRAGDIFGRWGGEEFLLVMADCTLDLGLMTLERLRGAVGGIELPAAMASTRLTLSAGLTTTEDDVHSLGALVARADGALYEAKHAGRDRVRVSEEAYRTASTGVRRAVRDATG